VSTIRVQITGPITRGRHTLACPTCKAARNWVVTGVRGSAATVQCRNRHTFWPEHPFDPRMMLAALAMPGARTRYDHLELG
jgi:hypothetical protein